MNGFVVLFVPLFLVGTMTVSCWEIASARASVPAEGTIIVDSNIPSSRGWHRGIMIHTISLEHRICTFLEVRYYLQLKSVFMFKWVMIAQ